MFLKCYSMLFKTKQVSNVFKDLTSYHKSMQKSDRKKKFQGKNLETKTLVKKSQFSEFLGKNVTGKNFLSFRFRWFFSPKIIWELPIKSQEITLQELKSWKKGLSLGSMRSSHKKDFSSMHLQMNIARGVFNIKSLFFHGCKHPLFPCIFQ